MYRTFRAALVALTLAGSVALAPALDAQARSLASRTYASVPSRQLDLLLERLRTATDTAESRELSDQVAEVLSHSGNPRVDSLLTVGNTALQRGELDRAAKLFDAAIVLAPDFAEAYNRRANVQYLRGDLDAAERDALRTLQIEGRHYGAMFGLGLVYEAREDFQRALGAYERALEIAPGTQAIQERVEELRKRLGVRIG